MFIDVHVSIIIPGRSLYSMSLQGIKTAVENLSRILFDEGCSRNTCYMNCDMKYQIHNRFLQNNAEKKEGGKEGRKTRKKDVIKAMMGRG